MSDRIEAEILDALGEEVAADVDTPLVVIEGTKGEPGTDGITPTIGPNGNWYLGEEDTGKPSRGAIGAPGKDGNPGVPGKDGAPGIYYGTTQPTGDTHPVWIDPDGGPDDGGLLPAVTAADNGKVLRVVSGAWASADMPEALPNPNALTFTGAVTGSYDGSAPLSVEIPSGGGSGSDISLGLTGAAVGQIAKITAVDDTGKPTAWSPVDMPSGGGGSAETFELIKYIKTTEAVNEIRINADDSGDPFELDEVQIYTWLYLQDDATAAILIKLHSSINGSATNYNWPFIAKRPGIKSNTAAEYPAVYAGHFKPKDYTIDNKKYWVADTWSANSAGTSSVAGAVNRIDFLINSVYETHVMDAVRCVMINLNNGAVQIGANSKIWIFGKRGKAT